MKMKFIIPLFYFILLLLNCQPINPPEPPPNNRQQQVQQTAEAYFATFSERKDWDKLCSFYREDLYFHDIQLHLELDSLWKFKRFYDWPNPGFKKLSDDQEHLNVRTLVANDSVAVAHGNLNPFYWHGEKVESQWGMEFTIILHFDENLKIYKQFDWMEYDPNVMESVIKRYREQGVEKLPDWLDLER